MAAVIGYIAIILWAAVLSWNIGVIATRVRRIDRIMRELKILDKLKGKL